MDGQVYTTLTIGARLYVGGDFVAAGGNTNLAYLACWDGTNWSAVGGGVNYRVHALASNGSDLYVGGEFWEVTQADGTALTACRLARWDGANWTQLGTGFDSGVNALVFSGGALFARGMFTGVGQADGTWTALGHLAQWKDGLWSAVGGGVDSEVFALAVNGASLYAGGFFSQATQSNGSHVTVNAVAEWNGSTWLTLGSGLTAPGGYPYVSSLAIVGNDLYAGGDFSGAGGTHASYIARWNGGWFPLGDGVKMAWTVRSRPCSRRAPICTWAGCFQRPGRQPAR